MTFHKAVTARI